MTVLIIDPLEPTTQEIEVIEGEFVTESQAQEPEPTPEVPPTTPPNEPEDDEDEPEDETSDVWASSSPEDETQPESDSDSIPDAEEGGSDYDYGDHNGGRGDYEVVDKAVSLQTAQVTELTADSSLEPEYAAEDELTA